MIPDDDGPNLPTKKNSHKSPKLSPTLAIKNILNLNMENQNDRKNWLNMNPHLNESDDDNCNNKLNGLNNGHNNHHINNNNHINKNVLNQHENNKMIINGGNNGDTNNVRRNSGTNVWSPLLQNETLTKNSDIKITDNNGTHNNCSAIYGPCSNNNDEWKESEEINNLRNSIHNKLGNNNGSLLMNGKNGLGIDKLLEENDPLTGKLKNNKNKNKNIYNDDNNININYDNTISDDYNTSNNSSSNNSNDDDNGSNCGIFGCQPKWAKNFASTHMFMVVFLLAWILQGMFLTYFVSVITTIEKLFQIKSRTTGMILSASEIGQISTAMLMTYYAGRGHRPRWIAWGMVLFSISAFGCALPHFMFGEQLMQSSMFINNAAIINSNIGSSDRIAPRTERLYDDGIQLNMMNIDNNSVDISFSTASLLGSDNLNLCLLSNNNLTSFGSDECEEDIKLEQASHSKITIIVLCTFFVSLLGAGVGQTAVSTLGIPYIDDNVASRESPIYMAITIGVRILGPAAGFIVGSFCTRIYVDLSVPDFNLSDPRWISAWWLGPVGIGLLMLIASIAMFSFPKQLRGPRISAPTQENHEIKPKIIEEKPKLKDFPKTVRRQLSNDILMFRTASSVFHLLPIAGLYTFLPKYLETQFRLPAADANLMTAFGGILVMGIGIVISGIVILKMNPSAKSVAAWIAFTALIYSCGMAILMFIGCNMDDFAGLTRNSDRNIPTIFEPTCNMTCSCDLKEFSPICGTDKKIYFSSCHAACSIVEFKNGQRTYSNCECIPDFTSDIGETYEAVGGYCDSNCTNFIYFICLFAFCVFMHSTSEVGSMLLIMRCTDPKDKAMAMGVIHSAIGLFGNVPCPIIYGAVVDSACLVWKTVCGKVGACSLYDIDSFRHYFLGITSGIMFIAFIMDLIVWGKAHRIDIAPEDSSTTETDFEKPINAPDTSV